MYYETAKIKANALINKKSAVILAIESSCDETAAAVIENGRTIRSNVISTQIAIHQKYGGVVPEIASRRHTQTVAQVVDSAMKEANLAFSQLDAVAVTCGPGLVGALLVGVAYAKALAFSLELPLIGVHHIEGHISANYLTHTELEPPFMALVVSGGHSHIVQVSGYGCYNLLGATRDDAAGEAFDKVARVLGLPYPGGIEIDRLSASGDPHAFHFGSTIDREDNYDFSFSGTKTAVVNLVHRLEQKGEIIPVADIAASFQESVVSVLSQKAVRAALSHGCNHLVIAGGVAANSSLRARLSQLTAAAGITLYAPALPLCTDNAAMIGAAAFYRLLCGDLADTSLNANASMRLFA